MEIIIQKDSDQAADVGARIIRKLLAEKPDAVLGLATGSTPVPMYRKLIEMDLDWSQVVTFNLDEYIGLPKEHPQSYHSFMWENLFNHINID
ncbi:MAG: 6-phosphogluconolactonase, partial [Akkermansiaceae bacterium]|nr:6-phosphogluconolactonase [Akkermansiaceae bacterium]